MPSLAFATHRMTKTPEFRCWGHIKTRCLNPRNPAYRLYGGRGITVCPEWLESFEIFYSDMGPRPSARHSIERKDSNKGYSPDNCIWALPAVQAANRSTVKLIEHDGTIDTMAGWARRSGIPYLRLRRRLVDGWSVERALMT
jgi:hypothetical protein